MTLDEAKQEAMAKGAKYVLTAAGNMPIHYFMRNKDFRCPWAFIFCPVDYSQVGFLVLQHLSPDYETKFVVRTRAARGRKTYEPKLRLWK